MCALLSRALAGLLLASIVVLLREQRKWCPLLGQPRSVSAVEPVSCKESMRYNNVSLGSHGDNIGIRDCSDLSNEGGLLGGDPRLCGAIMDFLS